MKLRAIYSVTHRNRTSRCNSFQYITAQTTQNCSDTDCANNQHQYTKVGKSGSAPIKYKNNAMHTMLIIKGEKNPKCI